MCVYVKVCFVFTPRQDVLIIYSNLVIEVRVIIHNIYISYSLCRVEVLCIIMYVVCVECSVCMLC